MVGKGLQYKAYSLYGICIRSDIWMPELLTASRNLRSAVIIRRGNVVDHPLSDSTKFGSFLKGREGDLFVSIPGVVSMVAIQGEELIYEPAENIDDDSLRLYLYGSGMAAILMQRGYLVLHGNALETPNGCVVCLGNSGAGKSTSAAGMLKRGYRVIADDICAITDEGYVVPGLPRLKLWQESADLLGLDTSSMKRIRPELEKFNIPLGVSFCDTARKIHSFVVLDQGSSGDVEVKSVSGMKKFQVLRENNYRPRYVRALGQESRNFLQITALAGQTAMTRISRPRSENFIDDVLDQVEVLSLSE